jgi:hypothetical protein
MQKIYSCTVDTMQKIYSCTVDTIQKIYSCPVDTMQKIINKHIRKELESKAKIDQLFGWLVG